MKTLLPAVLVLAAMSPTAIANSIDAGDRIRVTDRRGKIGVAGTVTSIGSRTLSLYIDHAEETVELDLQSVARLEKSLGEKRNTGKGSLIGGAVGLTFGVMVVAGTSEEDRDFFGSGIILAAVVAVTGVSAGLGALIGAATRTERWEVVPLDEMRVGLTWDRNAPRIGVTMEF